MNVSHKIYGTEMELSLDANFVDEGKLLFDLGIGSGLMESRAAHSVNVEIKQIPIEDLELIVRRINEVISIYKEV